MNSQKTFFDHRILTTKDGSSTVFSNRFNQHFHNPNGAVAESRQVYFEATEFVSKMTQKKKVQMLEVGFGTGLNALLALEYQRKYAPHRVISFETVEAYPMSVSEVRNLNFHTILSDVPDAQELLEHIFSNLTDERNSFDFGLFHLTIWKGNFKAWEIEMERADVILHDPFSPEANPDLWTPEVFEKLIKHSHAEVLLATYCAASKARAAMAKAGWLVARAPGALGKREMTLASLQPEKLAHLKRVNEKRLANRFYP